MLSKLDQLNHEELKLILEINNTKLRLSQLQNALDRLNLERQELIQDTSDEFLRERVG